LITRLTAGKVALGAIVLASFVTPQGWRLLVTIAALGLLFAAAGAYLGVDLEAERKENPDGLADPS
jgi:adenine/guanine phosphoribosyltransferase-like PRPP-binding protein